MRAAELDQHESTLGLQRFPEPLKRDIGARALVINVNHQDEINFCFRQLRIELGGADGLDVSHPGLAGVSR